MAKKTQITKTEKLQLIGLITLAHQAWKNIQEIDKAMVKIVGDQSNFGTPDAGLLSEVCFEETPDIDSCLKDMGIKVKK